MLPGTRIARRLLLIPLAVAAIALAAFRYHADVRWTPDGAIYLRMTLADLGVSPAAAVAETDRFMLLTAPPPQTRPFYGPHPPDYYTREYDLFKTRPLYPELSAPMYARFGPAGLKVVSVIAYAAAVMAMYALLLECVTATVAAAGAVLFAISPAVLEVAALPLTDSLALLFWVAALGAILRHVRTRGNASLAAALAATVLLTFTRPAVFLPFGAAAGAFFVMRGSQRRYVLPAGVAAAGVLFLIYTAASHGPGVAEQLHWQYDYQRVTGGAKAQHGILAWYALAEAQAIVDTLLHTLLSPALVLVGLAVLAIVRGPRAQTGVLLGALLATGLGLALNPIDQLRAVAVPAAPVLIALAAIGSQALPLWLNRRDKRTSTKVQRLP